MRFNYILISANILSVMSLVLFNCQKEIYVPQLPYDNRVSIQGIVEVDSVAIVYFNRTVPYLTGSTNTGDLVIRNATVRISASGEFEVLKLDSAYDKVDCWYLYFYKGSMKVKSNTTYTLEINDGTKMYSATASTTLNPVTIDSVTYVSKFTDLYGEHEGVVTYFNDLPNESNYYRYEMLREVDSTVRRGEKKLYGSCLASDTIMYRELGRSVYSDQNLGSQQIIIIVEPALSHRKDLIGLVSVQTIDKATYEFYDQLDRQKLAATNPFVEPFFLRDGQFGKDATGFFGSRIKSAPVKFVFPE